MRVYGYFYNRKGNLNYGIHEIDDKGKVKLLKKTKGLTFKPATDQDRLLDEEAIARFQKDIEETSLLVAIKDEEPLLRYVDNDVVNPHKVYYYGKDLELCFMCQDRALDCMEYIAHQRKKHIQFAYNFVYRYLELRENPEADLESLVRDATSETMIGIQHEI